MKKKIWLKSYKKQKKKKGDNKDINDMRAILNTSAPSLGEEGTKIIEDLKRQMVLMKKKNIKIKKKYSSKKIPKSSSKIVKILSLCHK